MVIDASYLDKEMIPQAEKYMHILLYPRTRVSVNRRFTIARNRCLPSGESVGV